MKLLILICLVLASSGKLFSKDKNGEPGRDGEMFKPHENNIQKEVNLNPTKLADYNEMEIYQIQNGQDHTTPTFP